MSDAGAQRADRQALRCHATLATTPMDAHVGQDWMAAAARL
jgi:hypothetical protein